MKFIEENRAAIEAEFADLCKKFPEMTAEAEKLAASSEAKRALALKYLYTAMPLSDMANYPCELFFSFAEHGVRLWEESAAVRALPEELYLEYVLFHRVNEEEIRPCREAFARELTGRIRGKSAYEAVVETNFWCAEQVTYRLTDERTRSAAAVCASGYGRCGEESTFCVNALRSVGIPARQVYVPKWAHCDDNHAWVEAWCEGEWYYLGACEPEIKLNLGWFREAASRAMMVHSRSFRLYEKAENVVGREGIVTILNQLPRYADAQKISVTVKEADGAPSVKARVSFCVLNFAEYTPIAEVETDEKGNADLLTGYGSLYLQVLTADGRYKGLPVNTQEQTVFVVSFGDANAGEDWQEIDYIAPREAPPKSLPIALSERQREEGSRRLHEAALTRSSTKADWENPEIQEFLSRSSDKKWRKKLLTVLSEKDLTDLKADMLEEHLRFALPYADTQPEYLFVPYVLNPRIGDEIQSAYRREIAESFSERDADDFRNYPAFIWEWIRKHIRSCPERERSSVITAPAACLRCRCGSEQSQKILFAAIARTFGIASRLNPQDGEPEYWDGSRFVPVREGADRDAGLILHASEPSDPAKWICHQNWSLSVWDGAAWCSLDPENSDWEDGKLALFVRAGRYRLITANRLPNGNQDVLMKEFTLKSGNCRNESLRLRKADLEEMLSAVPVPDFSLISQRGEKVSAADLTDTEAAAFFWLEEGREPTEHILTELTEQSEVFKPYAKQLHFVLKSEQALQDPAIKRTLEAIPGISIWYEDDAEHTEQLARRVYVDTGELPLVIVFGGSLNAVYAAAGYNVGIAALLSQILEWICR